MALALQVEADVGKLLARLRIKQKGMADAMRRDDFGSAVQSYITGVTTRFVRKMGDIQDQPASTSSRGVTWHGFSLQRVEKYDSHLLEGTRYRWRGFRKGRGELGWNRWRQEQAKFARAAKRKGLGGYAMPLKMEKVWNKRASGRKYSSSSKLMADTGHLLGFTSNVRRVVTTSGGVTKMTLYAGRNVDYFATQHKARPIWFWHPPTDAPRVRALLAIVIRRILRGAP